MILKDKNKKLFTNKFFSFFVNRDKLYLNSTSSGLSLLVRRKSDFEEVCNLIGKSDCSRLTSCCESAINCCENQKKDQTGDHKVKNNR